MYDDLLQEVRQRLVIAVEKYSGVYGKPPAWLTDELLGLVKSELASLDMAKFNEGGVISERLEDLVIAYGCGNWRQDTAVDYADYKQPWDVATGELAVRISWWYDATANWLDRNCYLDGMTRDSYEYVSARIVNQIKIDLMNGSCKCGGAEDRTTPNKIRRRERCLREHHLVSFNPAKVSLTDFIGQAVKGAKPRGLASGKKAFKPGAIEQGMIFQHLNQHFNIRYGNVLFWVCPNNDKHIPESAVCSQCQKAGITQPFNESDFKRNAKPRLFVEKLQDSEPLERIYQQQFFYRCQNCGNYYPERYEKCPYSGNLAIQKADRCGQGRTGNAKKSNVWVRIVPYITRNHAQRPPLGDTRMIQEDADFRFFIKQVLTPLEYKVWEAYNEYGRSIEELADQYNLPPTEIQGILKRAKEKIDKWYDSGDMKM